MATEEVDYIQEEDVELDVEGYGYGEYYNDDEINLFEENEEDYHEEAVEEVKKTIKPSRFKFVRNIQERVAEEIVEATEQYVSDDDSIYRQKVARDELFLSRMLKVSGVVFVIVVVQEFLDTIKSILKRKLVLYIISVAGPTLLTIFGFLVALVIFLVAISGGPNGSGGTSSCGNEPESSITVDGIVSSSAASDADWTKPGTTAYKTAKKVFMAWVNLGLDGGAAAGIVGWTQTEGGTVMIGRAEGHFGNDIKANSIMYGNVPIGQSYYKTAAGGGIYQFTPYTKYAPLNDPKWEDADAMNDFVAKAILNGDWNAGMDMSGKSRSFEQMAKEKDPQSATLAWQAYERGNPAQIPVEKKKAG